MPEQEFGFVVALAAAIAAFLTAIYGTAYALHYITPS